MPSYLDLERWSRRGLFELFRGYEQPFFGLCAPLDVTALRAATGGAGGRSFFLATLWASLATAQEIEPFRYRLEGERVAVHEAVSASCTVLRPDGSFGFATFEWDADFGGFHEAGRREVERVRAGREIEPSGRDDLIHYTVIPWVELTAFRHARGSLADSSVPKVVLGKVHRDGDRERMPVALEVHHALMDGYDAGRWYQALAARFADPSWLGSYAGSAGARPSSSTSRRS